ncbi:MAG: ATP-binding cassette domain-containing protein [Pseudomonadota bacterium]
MSADLLARFVGVEKTFGDHRVLDGIDLVLPRGGTTFIVGPSGTGKSVLVKHLVGFISPDAGEIWYGDVPVHRLDEEALRAVRRRCVYVFQHPALFDAMTVEDNVRLVIQQHRDLGVAEQRREVFATLERLGIDGVADQSPRTLSSGEQKLVSIARAMAMDPETLILDEPTTGLDPEAARRLDGLVTASLRGESQLIVISHDLRSIELMADRVVMLLGGKVHFQGSRAAFFTSTDPAVAQFVAGSAEGPI